MTQPTPPATSTEWTWRHNAYISTARATSDRAEAERVIAILQRNNPGDPVTLMRRTVTEWTPAGIPTDAERREHHQDAGQRLDLDAHAALLTVEQKLERVTAERDQHRALLLDTARALGMHGHDRWASIPDVAATLAADLTDRTDPPADWRLPLDDDQDEPTTAEKLATTAQAGRDVAEALARTEVERDRALADVTRIKTHLVNETARLRDHLTRTRTERDQARHRAAVHADTLLHIHTALDTLPDGPQLRSRIRNLIAAGRDAVDAGPTFAGLGSPTGRAQDQVQSAAAELLQHLRATEPLRPAGWEQRAIDVVRDALNARPYLDAHLRDTGHLAIYAVRAVRAIIDAGLAGPGGRCPTCQATYPRTPAPDSDGRCWTCTTADQGGTEDEPPTAPQSAAWHWGRSWTGHAIEDSCPCHQADCGLVDEPDPECPEHGLKAAKSVRQSHPADRCPGQEG